MLGLLLLLLQSDSELADRLARRGWSDLADAVYAQAPGPEADLGRARLKLAEAEREEDPARRLAAFQSAGGALRPFRREASSELASCLKEIGRLLALDGKPDAATAAFVEAEALFEGDALEGRYELGLVLLARGIALKSAPHLRRIIDLFTNELPWLADQTVLLYELHLQAGRAWEALDDIGGVPDARNRAIVAYGKARGALAYDVVEAREVGSRGALLEMRARIRVGTPRSLVEAVRVAEEFSKLKRRPEGVVPRLIRLEHGRALGLLGRIAQAVPLLQALRVDAKNTPIESAALDVLAEIAGASNPKIALDAAEDLLERGEATKAAVRFVTCLTLFRGRPEEPRCLTGLGTAYLRSGRWLEAIAAFTMLETIKADTAETGMFKLSALRRQKDLTRDPADIKVYQDHRARMASKGGGDFLIEEEALEFEAAGNYKAAAATWAKLASDRALYRRARAVFLQPDPAAAIDLFRRHLAKAPASPEAFRSTVYAARCLVQLGKPDEALAIAEGAESKWPNQDPKMLQWLILQRAQAKAAQGKAADAEAEVAAIERIWKKEQTGLDYLSRALAVAAEAWERAAKDDAGWERAARLWHRYFEINPPDPTKDAGRLEAIACKLVEIAPRVKDAKDLWAMARDLYAQLRATRRGDTDAIRRLEAKCFAGMGRFEDAVDVLRELTAADPGMQNGTLWEELGDAYLAWGRSLEKGSVRTERIRKAADIYSSLSAALRRGEGPHFWRVTYRRAECLWETDLESLRDFFADMARRGYATRWDGGEFKPKFEALKAKLEERLPGRK